MSTYTVIDGQSIGDVVMNATGSLTNWDAILTANGFADWVPDLSPGQVITIPDDLVTIDANTQRQLASYPACNNSSNDVVAQIATLFGILDNNWILATGFWNNNGVWINTAVWID